MRTVKCKIREYEGKDKGFKNVIFLKNTKLYAYSLSEKNTSKLFNDFQKYVTIFTEMITSNGKKSTNNFYIT